RRSPARRRPPSSSARRLAGPHTGQPAALQLAQERPRLRTEPAGVVEERLGLGASIAGERHVLAILEGRDPQPREPRLDEAEDIPLAAQLGVLLRKLEAVAGLDDRLEPCLRRLVDAVGDEDAEALRRPAPDPATELVELGEPEPVSA